MECLSKESLTYTRCYCEENIYKLCEHLRSTFPEALDRSNVVFISNERKQIPLWCQKASLDRPFVIWDYHVILLIDQDDTDASTSLIYDFDSTLPFPCAWHDYTHATFQPFVNLRPEFQRVFRVIPARAFLQSFASDRSHMIREDGTYYAPPPTYAPIVSADGSTMTLPRFQDMISTAEPEKYGVVMDMDTFLNRRKA
ncbi:N-terminal glutamine amidase-domain-containing protein [Gongronella butleri]|nr:N-terminal glutamine amidase-domain-containing protein [Gongronella butleri]